MSEKNTSPYQVVLFLALGSAAITYVTGYLIHWVVVFLAVYAATRVVKK